VKGDKFYFSPDVGRIVLRGKTFYAADGRTYKSSATIRMMQYDEFDENYADWTDEKRAQVLAESMRKERDERDRQDAELRQREVLRESARGKLTIEEYDAVWLAHRDGAD
jgi:ligand-binding sensor domain-containing protein